MEHHERELENAVYSDYFTRVANGEPVDERLLEKNLETARAEYEAGEDPEEALFRALHEHKDDKMWREFAEIRTSAPSHLKSNDPEIWFPSYHSGSVAASMFDEVTFNGRKYKKGLRYSSLHDVTEYKNLSKQQLLRGSSQYEINEDGGLEPKKKKKLKKCKESDLELSPVWLKWVERFGIEKYGLNDSMLGTKAVIDGFENDFADESKLYKQKNIFDQPVGYIKREEPPKYTGRVKNPFWEFWTRYQFSKNCPELKLEVEEEVQPILPLVYKTRYGLNLEPEKWVWPEQLHGLEMPKLKKATEYTVPKSKLRAKMSSFFQVEQSKKFMAFYTVSFPAGIPDEMAYKLFHIWLNRLRDKDKGIGLKSYLWVAERQEGTHKEEAIRFLEKKKANALSREGKSEARRKKVEAFYDQKIRNWKPSHSIHFHLLTNNYMPIMVANHYMKASLKTRKKRGDKFLKDFDVEKYNGVDVKLVTGNRKKLGYYLSKYVTKNDTAIPHAVWRSSHDISALFTEELTEDDKRYLMWQMLQARYVKKGKDGKEKKAPMYRVNGRFVDKTWIPPWILARVNGLLVDTNQKIYDLFDDAKGGDMEEFLKTAYKQTPIWAIWKELENLKKRKKALFREQRMRSALKVAKRKEKKEFFKTQIRDYHKMINNRIKKLIKWAKEEGFEL